MKTRLMLLICIGLASILTLRAAEPDAVPRGEVLTAMKKAAEYFRTKVAVRGGYVYQVSPDLKQREGEGKATATQIWVQKPGTPAVGMACLTAHAATGDAWYLDAAKETAEALVFGQLESGGWTHSIDFDPASSKAGRYRNGKGRAKGRNQSSLDDGVTQNALRFLMHADRALSFKHAAIHEAAEFARASLLKAQFPHGGFPQGWDKPVAELPVLPAKFPDYDWRTENRIKEYWGLPTLNDNLSTDVTRTLIDAWEIYKDEGCRRAVAKLGDFLILAQMPEPQPGWAQQYDREMRPAWARKFEPPALAGSESQDAIQALLTIHRFTGDAKYLEPIPRALAWLKRSALSDGRLARFYELRTNKPLYMTHEYVLTYDDSDVPSHYGWKGKSRIVELEAALKAAREPAPSKAASPPGAKRIREIIASMDAEGRWLTARTGKPEPGAGEKVISSEVFIRNLEMLSAFAAAK
ncbi:MAG TPA: pectate lyase [Verrucomicrobiales bacterium]|nr:pectate lyase [Verrucomicrobiales bacterium]